LCGFSWMLQVLRPESRKPGGFDIRIGSSNKSQAKIQTAARRESSEDSMKKAFLLIVVPALLVALGWAQTPAASNTDLTIKGCVGGSDGNYTVMEDNTGHIFKITSNGVELKQHLGHDVTLIGHRITGASSGAADSGFAVTELNMISEHCAAAAAAPAATGSTAAETIATPDAAAAAAASATIVPPAETAVVPATDPASPATTVNPPAETIVTPDAAVIPPVETDIAPAPDTASTATAAPSSTPWDSASIPSLKAADATRPRATSRKRSATADAAAITPAAPAGASSETASTPTAAAAAPAAPSETASTPDAPATAPAPPARHGALLLLIALGVLVIVIGTLVPFLSRWRRRKMLEQTSAPNLSFTREASSDEEKPEDQRKAA
jgi:hypothetical protein